MALYLVLLGSLILVQASSDQCLAIKNSKERLKCYDEIANKNPKRNSSDTFQSNPGSNSLTLNQKNEVSTAIRALRKMVSITETGINQQEYTSRLLDMTTTVDEALRNIPESQVKTNILRSKKAYVDANKFWSDIDRDSAMVWKIGHPEEVRLYELKLFTNKTRLLSGVWEKGREGIEAADALLQSGRLNP